VKEAKQGEAEEGVAKERQHRGAEQNGMAPGFEGVQVAAGSAGAGSSASSGHGYLLVRCRWSRIAHMFSTVNRKMSEVVYQRFPSHPPALFRPSLTVRAFSTEASLRRERLAYERAKRGHPQTPGKGASPLCTPQFLNNLGCRIEGEALLRWCTATTWHCCEGVSGCSHTNDRGVAARLLT